VSCNSSINFIEWDLVLEPKKDPDILELLRIARMLLEVMHLKATVSTVLPTDPAETGTNSTWQKCPHGLGNLDSSTS